MHYKYYDIMQVDLIDLMELPDRVLKPTCDEECAKFKLSGA